MENSLERVGVGEKRETSDPKRPVKDPLSMRLQNR